MALSRLANLQNDPTFAKIYVDPNSFDATDSIENRGTSPNRPFASIQRAAIEAAMSSYVRGRNNDRNDRTTIVVSSGTHYIDNRPGFSIQNISNTPVFKKRTGVNTWTTSTINPFSETSNFDLFDVNNDLYKFNSIHGGIVLPRGTSIVGLDLRKTKIRPLYIPDPLDNTVERSSILNVTGSCYFSTFTFFDADVTKFSYKNYTDSKHVPKYSHHKLTTFVYADGVNKVRLGLEQTDLTDLEMYYYKISHAYNTLSGRDIPDYPQNLDFEPNIDEFRIVGAFQENPIGISSIRAGNGDGTGDSSIITVTTANLQSKIEEPHNFAVDTPIIIKGITQDPNSFNGSFTVREVVGLTTFTFITPVPPQINQLPPALSFDTATVSVESDTVSSASPYIFNCSLRSVYGMCGMWADGARADGFKSMVVAQYTGISLQKDDDAYLIYDDKTFYDDIQLKNDVNRANLRPLHQNSRAIYKPDFENFHIRASNDAFIQCVSIFAIGYSKHFVTESGADMSITNSNSNFGANALNSVGYRKVSFDRDDTGYITHIIPPRELTNAESEINWIPLDITKIKAVGNQTRLYLNGFTLQDVAPEPKIENFRVGARVDDKLYLSQEINDIRTTYSASICMPVPVGASNIVARKEYQLVRTNGINEITNNILSFTGNHQLFNGERIRIFADTGQAPDGLEVDKIYYAITTGLNPNQIRIASTLNDAIANTPIPISGIKNNGGRIRVVSTVTDKKPGELGHPVQWDATQNQWYLTVAESNEIYANRNSILNPTPTTFIRRLQEERTLDDRLYKIRYVVPKEYINGKPPQVGFILQESKNVALTTSFDAGIPLLNSTELRNNKIIINATAGTLIGNSQIVTITTELPHNFVPGDTVKIQNIRSTNNSSATGIVSTYNGEYKILTIPASRQFTYRLEGVKVNPGTFTNNPNQRTTTTQKRNLPLVSRLSYKNNFYIYSVDTIQSYNPGESGKDGIYHLTVLSSSVDINQNVGYGLSQKSFRQDVRNLYPQVDRDNYSPNPNSTESYADLITVGRVITDDKKKSITLETVNKFNSNNRVGFGITNIAISGVGNTTITLFTDVEHKLNPIKSLTLTSSGTYPTNTTVFSSNLVDLKFNEEDATCRYSTDGSGSVISTSIGIVDAGAAHTVGETLGIVGGAPNAIVQVSAIHNHIGDGLELFDFQTTNLNGIYEIISVPNKKSVVLHVPSGVSTYIPNTSGRIPIGYLASKGVGISSAILSDLTTGIATVTTNEAHGLVVGNKFKYINSNLSFYNQKDFVVNSVIGITTFTFNVGIATTTTTPTTGKILKYGISSNALTLENGEDNLASRGCYIYAGITTTLTAGLTLNSNTITVVDSNGLKKGDFILINNEILRVSLEPSGNTLSVLRNQLGTSKATASSGSVLRKIKVLPMETRRPSYMRASGHTFEYLGFGPGNYSTALPQRQDRILSEDEVLVSQAKKEQAGIVVYTGMNDLGEFYTGSKKSSAITNKETTIEAPVITFTGDDIDGEIIQTQTGIFDDLIVRNNILVEGSGSQFFGTVEFKNKLTNHSDQGITVKNLYIKNRDASTNDKLIVVSNSVPTLTSIPNPINGNISFLDIPLNYIGHTYKDGSWRQWGLVSSEPNRLNVRVDSLGIGKSADSTVILNVAGISSVNDLYVNGLAFFNANVVFANAAFSNLTITKTATFNGINTAYTQVHEQGISKLFNLEVVGVSTFTGISTFNSRVDIDNLVVRKNINIGVADSNTISTQNGNLRLVTPNGKVNVASDLSVTANEVSITTSRSSGFATAFITDSRILRLGVGNTNQTSYVDLNNDTRVFSDFGLRISRNSGIGSQSSSITHRGNQSLILNAQDIDADVKIATRSIDRLVVGTSGTVTYIQNNSGQNLAGAHFRINQGGFGDASLSWDCADPSGNGNPTYRWYAGIDTSDGYSWKLAAPTFPTTTSYGNENYDSDAKLRIDNSGNTNIISTSGILTINGSNFNTNQTTFNLLNSTATTVNAFGSATSVGIGSTAGILTLKNPTVVGTQATQNLYDTVATTVNAFGAATSLNLGANSGTLTLRNPTLVGVNATQNLFNTVATTVNAFGAATSLNLGANSGTLTIGNPTIVGTQATQNLFTTSNVILGSTTGTLTLNSPTLVGVNATQNLFNTLATTVNAFGSATSLNLGANSGTLTIGNPTIVGTQATQNLYNTVATTVNAFGAATSLNLGAISGTTIIRNNLTINGVASFITAVNINEAIELTRSGGAYIDFKRALEDYNARIHNFTSGAITVEGNFVATGTITANSDVIGTQATQNLFNTAITVNAFNASTSLNLGATAGTTTIRNTLSVGTINATTITATLNGNASTSTTFSTTRANYKDVTDGAVAGQLMWKNYGNGHTIFDASQSTSPQGGAVNNTNSQIAWSSTYPTLMGWNGVNTYGVRVDSARNADLLDGLDTSSTDTAGNSVVVRSGGNFSAGTVTATTFVGGGTIPVGGIIMWSGSVATIPTRWALCNGSNGTPDLRDRFIVGAGNVYSPGNTGGANSVTLTTQQIPSHSHTASSTGAGGHGHTASTASAGTHYHRLRDGSGGDNTNSITRDGGNLSGQSQQAGWVDNPQIIEPAGSHSHSVTVDGVGNHSHTITVNNNGGGESHENRPPYYALAFIMRTS